jgi:ubiquinol-cytochrome c reductase cytochrome b subunit
MVGTYTPIGHVVKTRSAVAQFAFVNDPSHPRFYGRDNDRMPSYGTEKSLSQREIEMVVDWIRQEWYTPKTAVARK